MSAFNPLVLEGWERCKHCLVDDNDLEQNESERKPNLQALLLVMPIFGGPLKAGYYSILIQERLETPIFFTSVWTRSQDSSIGGGATKL